MSNTGEATTTAREQEEQDAQTTTAEQQSQGDNVKPAGNDPQAYETAGDDSEPKPDVSDQGYQELLPKLMELFQNSREKLAVALGLHRSTIDRWLNGKSRPNNSTVLRMRRLAQERRIE